MSVDIETYTEVPTLWELAADVDPGVVSGACPNATNTEQVDEVLNAMHDQEADAGELHLEADPYYCQLIEWLKEHGDHVGFVDDALSEYGGDIGLYGGIAMGQVKQLEAIAFEVEAYLEELQVEIEEHIEEREEEQEE